MTQKIVSADQVFDDLTILLKKQFPGSKDFRMPYCSLIEDPISKEKHFRVEIWYKRKSVDWLDTKAIAKVDPESGAITYFRDNSSWTAWV